MGEQILNFGALVGVFVGCEPDEAIIVEIQPQRIDTCHQEIQSEVKFGLIDQVRSRNVPK